MKNRECRRNFYTVALLLTLLAVALIIGACTTPEKAKAQHVARGQALLKDKKFQEASLEFRAAMQIDDRLADAHWGLANAYEGLQRYLEAFDEMKQTVELDANGQPAAVRRSNSKGGGQAIEDVLESWRVDDEWWRLPISRRYCEVVLEGGKRVVLFEDLHTGEWFIQQP